MRLGPILRHELTRAARRRDHYLLRVALGLILLHVAWTFYVFGSKSVAMAGGRSSVVDPRSATCLAELVFLELAWTQGLAILLLGPGLVAGSIAEEDRRGTMLDLLASPLSGGAIVLGKLAARLVHFGVALAIGLPMVVPLGLLGALQPAIVACAYAMLVALALFVGSLSLLVSALSRRPREAILAAYLLVGGWLLLPIGFAPIARGLSWPFAWLRTLNDWVLLSNPVEAALCLWWIPGAKLSGNASSLGLAWSGLSRTFPWVVATQLATSAMFLLLAALGLRPLRLGPRGWGMGWARRLGPWRVADAPARPDLGDDPMLWKERYASGRSRRPMARLAVVLLVALIVGPLLGPAGDAFREWRASWRGGPAMVGERWELNGSLRQLNAGLYLLGLVAVAAAAATSVTGERERGTWTSLATTLVTGREVARAKVAGALRGVRRLAAPFLALWGLGLATGSVHPLGVLAAAAGLVVFARFAAALGVLCSMVSATSNRAILATLLALLAGNALALLFVPLDLIGPLAGSRQAVFMAGMTPFVEWISLASSIDIRKALEGRPWDGALRLPFGLWNARVLLTPDLLRTYAASLALHAVGSVVALRAAAWAFDAGRGEFQFPRPVSLLWGPRRVGSGIGKSENRTSDPGSPERPG